MIAHTFESEVAGSELHSAESVPAGDRAEARSLLPAQSMPRRSALDLLQAAHDSLAAARGGERVECYVQAHRAALQAGAAVIATRAQARPSRGRAGRGGPVSVWSVLGKLVPGLAEWASYFEASAPIRAAAEAGITGVVSERAAADLLRDSERFVRIIEQVLDLPVQLRLG